MFIVTANEQKPKVTIREKMKASRKEFRMSGGLKEMWYWLELSTSLCKPKEEKQ